jgi:hypothetical protein
VKGDDFAAHYNEMAARVAADDLSKAARPATADEYKIELPKDFQVPSGVEFKFNEGDPLLSQARTMAHEMGIAQEDFSKLLGLYAAAQVTTASSAETARQAEIAKLGPNATARIDAIERYYNAVLGPGEGKAITARLWTSADVQRQERLIARSTGTAAPFTGSGREPPPAAGRKTDAEIAKMSPGERLDYARSFTAPPVKRAG